jgi:hypothetical protein
MKIELELTDQEARLIHTFIRRSIYEQYFRNMAEAGDTEEEAKNRTYDAIQAVEKIRNAIADEWNK